MNAKQEGEPASRLVHPPVDHLPEAWPAHTGYRRSLPLGHPPLESMIIMCREFGWRLARDPVVRADIRLTFEASSFGHRVDEPYSDWIKVLESLSAKAAAMGQLRPGTDPGALARGWWWHALPVFSWFLR
ncbi:MAG: hypothetical protein ACQEXN_14570 [Actinomycetota bacterium]